MRLDFPIPIIKVVKYSIKRLETSLIHDYFSDVICFVVKNH